MLIGYAMFRVGWIGSGTLSDLTGILINAVIPCAFILAMTRSFTPGDFLQGAKLSAVVGGFIGVSFLIGTAWFRVMPGGSRAKERSVTAMMMIPNSVYLPLPVILALTPDALQDTATVYISIAALPSTLVLWSAGVLLLNRGSSPSLKSRLKMVLNPPLLSVLAGIALALVPGVREAARGDPGAFAPLKTVFSIMGYLALMLSPLAMLVLGGLIAGGRGTGKARLRFVAPLLGIRLVLVPAVVYALIRSGILNIPALAGTVLLTTAAAPPATNLALIARRCEGEWELVSKLQLIAHLAALATLPVWLALGLGL